MFWKRKLAIKVRYCNTEAITDITLVLFRGYWIGNESLIKNYIILELLVDVFE